ncbi:hypothetical protein GCM10023096_35250 [Nonomuraea ferruginea]
MWELSATVRQSIAGTRPTHFHRAMTVTRREIVAVLTRYLGAHPGRAADAVMLAQALDREQDLASRETLPLHVTTSAVAIDGSGWVLMIRHSAQDRCLLPGGHVEPSDDSLCDAALRELEAGTGVPRREVVVPAETVPVDIEVHEIPADPARGVPSHQHADFRFAFRTLHARITPQAGSLAWRDPAGLLTDRLVRGIAAILSSTPPRVAQGESMNEP